MIATVGDASRRLRAAVVIIGVAASLLVSAADGRASSATSTSVALRAGPRRMAEPAVAVDPRDARRIAVAADPYLAPVRIQVTTSADGGATWSTPTEVVPPGFAKSYDPTVAFDRDGNLLVVGGASGQGRPRCQPASAVFLAEIRAGGVSYSLVRDARVDGAYVDRPQFAYDARRDRLYVDWTESSGPGAECRGTPARSQISFTAADRGQVFETPRPLPSSGLPAPFGAPIAVGRDGTVAVAVGEHEPGRRSRAVVVRSTDRGTTFGPPAIALEVPVVPTAVAGIGGFVAPTPSIALGPRGATAVAWSHHAGATATPTVVVDEGAGWRAVPPPADAGPVELLAQVAYDRAGRLWTLSAQATGGAVRFVLRDYDADIWSPATVIAEGRGGAYLELGEGLGLAIEDDTVVGAVPVDATVGSTLIVSRTPAPPPPPTTTQPPSAGVQPATHSSPTRRRGDRWQTVALAVAAALSLGLVLQRRHVLRRHGARRSSGSCDSP